MDRPTQFKFHFQYLPWFKYAEGMLRFEDNETNCYKS